jgi:uncharacterized protein
MAPRVHDDPPRRLQPAGHAVIAVFLALALGALLDARGLRKTATIQPEGWKRDVALALTRPLVSVSNGLLLDRPRRGVKAVLGRSDDDRIETEVVLPPPPVRPQPPPIHRKSFTPERKLRIWIAGDSLVVVPGESLERAALASPVVDVVGKLDGRLATGLTRPDVFNWFTEIPKQVRRLHPDVVVLSFGANDDHNLITGVPKGREIGEFGGPSWIAEYRRRVAGLMTQLNRRGVFVVWIGLPITREEDQTARFEVLNRVVSEEARRRLAGAAFVDTYPLFQDDTGHYAEYLPNESGELIKMRQADGVHFEREGGDRVAREVLKKLNARFDLTSWRKRPARARRSR